MANFIRDAFLDAKLLLEKILSSDDFVRNMDKAIALFAEALANDCKAISCGNGGSMCDAIHFAEELSGRFKKNRPALAALAISDPGHLSCVANDFGYQEVFSRYVEAVGKKGDVLLAISTSGNSENVMRAVTIAKTKGIKTVALLGKEGGKLKDMVDVPLIVPTSATERIQEVHIKIIHLFIEGIERKLFPELY